MPRRARASAGCPVAPVPETRGIRVGGLCSKTKAGDFPWRGIPSGRGCARRFAQSRLRSSVDGIGPSPSKDAGSVKWYAATPRITPCRRTFTRSAVSERRLAVRGACRFGDAVSATGCPGNGWRQSSSVGSLAPVFSIPGLSSAFASEPKARAQCGSSARWDPCGGRPEPRGKGRPYRDPCRW
jgi:hypothetical protein